MEGYLRLLGTQEESFQFGLNGPKIVAVGTKLRVRDETNGVLARLGVDFPSDGEDAVPLDYLNSAIIDLVPISRLINTADGVQGGGNLSGDLTLSLDVNGLTQIFIPDNAADYLLVWDNSAGAHRKWLIDDLLTIAGGGASQDTFQLSCGRNANGTNIWLRGADGVPLNQAPWRIPYDCTLTAISATTAASETWDAEVYIDADVRAGGTPSDANKIAELVIAAANSAQATGLSVAVTAGTEVGVFCRGTAINTPHVKLWFER